MAETVKVTFSADDQATEVVRKLLETLRGLERAQRQTAQSTAALAKPAQDAASAFTQMQVALGQLGKTADLSAVAKGVSLLAEGLKSATTSAQSLARLREAESQFQRALAQGNITLEQRIELERGLRQVQAAIAGPANAAAAALERQRQALSGSRASGIDAVSKRVALLSDGLQSASTRAESLTRLTAAESQLQRALQRGNLTLNDRIRIERELRGIRGAIAGNGPPVDLPEPVLNRFQRLHASLLAIATALGAIRLLGFAKDAVDAADNLNDLSQRTGVAVESLSVLRSVAQKSGTSIDDVAVGFRQLSKSVVELQQGNAEVVESFRAIGISANDLKGLSLDQVLVRIANAMARFDDGAGKSAIATRLLGRSGEALIPLLDSLANGGFANATEKARALGGVISTEAASAADEFNDSLSDLRTSISGFGNELASALSPLADLVNTATGFLAAIPGGVKAFAAAAVIAGAAATALAAAVGALVIAFGALATVTGVGVIVGAITAIALAAGGLAAAFRSAREEKERLTAPLNKDSVLAGLAASGALGSGNITLQDPAQVKALRQARLQAARQQAREEQQIQDTQLKQSAQIEEARFAQGLTSLTEYFRARVEIAKQGTANEVRALEQELASLRSSPLADTTQATRETRAREIATLENQIKRTKIEGESQLLALIEQERVARKSALEEAQSFQQQLFELQGQGLKAQQIQIEQSAEKFAKVLSSLGVDGSVVSDLRNAFSTLLTDRAAFDNQERLAQQQITALARERAEIQQRVATGDLSQRDGVLALAQAERNRLPALQQAATLMAQFADRVGDPALQESARQLQQSLSQMGVVIDQAKVGMANFKDAVIDAGQNAFTDFLGRGITEARTGFEALVGLAKAFAASVQQIAANIAGQALFQRLRQALDGKGLSTGATQVGIAATALGTAGNSVVEGGVAVAGAAGLLQAAAASLLIAVGSAKAISGATAGLSSLPGALGFAGGGFVRGPGTGMSDSIPARLSAGEYVIRASVVRAIGVQYLNALNGLHTPRVRSLDSIGIPRFAEGGLVVQPAAERAASNREDTLRAIIDLSPDLILREITSSRGLKVLAKKMGQHPTLFRSALG